MAHSMNMEFQKNVFSNREFPFILHIDTLSISYKVLPHWHSEVEILYFQSGECYAYCDQKKIHCEPGDILFCNSYCFHGLEEITETCSYICYFFEQELLYSMTAPFIPKQDFIHIRDKNLQEILEKVRYEFYTEKAESQAIISYNINLFYMYLHRILFENNPSVIIEAGQKSTGSSKKQDKQIKSVLLYINEHICEHISLTEVCSLCGLSTSRFSILFKQYTGKSMVDYINICRCRLAYNYYTNNGYTVCESANAAGFENLSYFSRKFKEIYGCTLSQIPR